ncbi:TOPRIM nucleotidyl transferase/hydrolase domain-containing protein [Streptomyces sp. NPDC090306]|uniref:TOPRIM nucleotidyl transferase/hydrolase domain-containing protein n=1 Tax=Streptomyces sp. NPDC090306 TaxID=3365961 RepID=UPI003813BFD7
MADMEAFRDAVIAWAADNGDGRSPIAVDSAGPAERARRLAELLPVRAAVLLEGPSDAAAVGALAAARGRDLAAEGVCVLPMGGAMSVGRFARALGPGGLGIRIAGLCDVNELPFYERALTTRTGDGTPRADIFVCAADLEDELVRALGVGRVREVVRAAGDLRSLQTFLSQPAQRDRQPEQRLRRFFGTKKGRKIRYGRLLVEALDAERVPAPLDALLTSL